MSLDGLYREIILDHYQNPRNKGTLEDADSASHGHNPLCGDEVDVFLKLDHERLADVRFTSRGCSISQASASMMTDSVKGRAVSDAESTLASFKEMMLGEAAAAENSELGDLEALQGVKRYPVRIKCALLPWNTLKEALDSYRAHHES